MRKSVILLFFVILCMGFKEIPPFEKRLLTNFSTYVYGFPHEKLYLHTDKSVYTVGEKVWFRAYLVNGLNHMPNVLSRYIYAELVDRRDSVIARVKILEMDSCFQGHINLPLSLLQGDYCLRAYSYYMQNDGEDYLFKKKLRIVNPQDSRVKTTVSYSDLRGNKIAASIQLTDAVGEPFKRAVLSYSTNETRDVSERKTTVADKYGIADIKIDSGVKFVELSFQDGIPFAFKRRFYVPQQFNDFDVQFFPEGGTLLAGNWQNVAFKAIGQNGMSIDVTGEVYQDSILIGEFKSEHDGMGRFRLPVSPGHRYSTKVKLSSGEEKDIPLPEPSETGMGLSVELKDSVMNYRIMKGIEAEIPDSLYLFIHSRGNILGVEKVDRLFRGQLALEYLPEGIAHVLLMDSKGVVYSERIVFVKKKNRPELEIRPDKSVYTARELVSLNLSLLGEDIGPGTFSMSVTDDTKVPLDTLEDHILSSLLMTSDLKGYINDPAYYFDSDTPEVDAHLDLLMMTHGWTRFDASQLALGKMPSHSFPLEVGQVVSGKVNNFWGKKTEGANIILLSNTGIIQMVETDKEGNFLIDGIVFADSTQFLVQALNAKGRRGVSVSIDEDELITAQYSLPYTLESKEEEDEFYDKYGLDYYYENGEKVYILNEVLVIKRKQVQYNSFYDAVARTHVDSAAIAEMKMFDIIQLIQILLPGVMLERGEEGEEYFSHFGRRLYLLANDFEENMDFIRMIHPEALLSISLLDQTQGFMFFGSQASGGALIISYKLGYVPPRPPRPNIKPFTLLGIQKPVEFYVPKYDVDSVRRDSRYDTRSTIYWNPKVKISLAEETELSFFTADTPGRYSVVLEGVTVDGRVCRKRIRLTIK